MLVREKLFAFRDSPGRIGVLDHRCPHRCASLFFGRNEEGGLRCVYHGWKFDTAGNCLDMPNSPEDQDIRHKVKAKSYQVSERGGVVYVYMGEREVAPPLPAIQATRCPAEEVNIACVMRECNWLQALEGDIDTSHFSFLHTGKVEIEDIDPNHLERFQLIDRAPRYNVKTTDWGTIYAAYRPAEPGHLYYRFAYFAFPFWTLFPNGPLTDNILTQAWVPMTTRMSCRSNSIGSTRPQCSAATGRINHCRFSRARLKRCRTPPTGSVGGAQWPIGTTTT
jgi:phenylpropionate dioxygenase-like ring-hydroxylating dioxygenase large terminal subunit